MGTDLIEDETSLLTTKECNNCSEVITFTEELFVLQIVQIHKTAGGLLLHPATADDGDYLYAPLFFQFNCWEDVQEGLLEEIEDVPSMDDAISTAHCVCCKSGIRDWEKCGALSLGELHRSKRAPQGSHGEEFVSAGEPSIICLYCLFLVQESEGGLWDEICENEECGDCLQLRCWRTAPCACDCHIVSEEEGLEDEQR